MRHELQPVSDMVEAGERVGDDKHAVGHLQRVCVGQREALEVPGRFVTEVSDGAAAKAFGKAVRRLRDKCLEVRLQRAQRVGSLEIAPPARILHRGATVRDRDDRHGVRRNERITPELFPAFDALQEIGGSIGGQRRVRRHRRQRVRKHVAEDRDHRRAPSALFDLIERQRDSHLVLAVMTPQDRGP